jgi:ubiquinone/menaquinone biosynthesis C-methylase UbiE
MLVRGSRVAFLSGDAYALSHPDASFDLATARFVFQHLQNHAGATSELPAW